MSGYAWSPNIGWISFNSADVSTCGAAPAINLSTGAVTGYAIALAGSGRSDGWNGCIELSGANHASPDSSGYQGTSTKGVTMNTSTNTFSGYAWGGYVVGWIIFSSGGGTPPITCPTCGGDVPVLTGSCTATTPYQLVLPNTSVTFKATLTNGTSPYKYSWAGAATSSSSTYISPTYSSSGSGPALAVEDSASPKGYGLLSCPNVTVLQPLYDQDGLLIGRDVASANFKALSVNSGSPFALAWNFIMTTDYSCSTSGGNGTYWPSWNSLHLATTTGSNGTYIWGPNDTGTSLTTGAAPIGSYRFTINCTSGTNPATSTSATLRVTSSSENEF
jgi:hypothetical protein